MVATQSKQHRRDIIMRSANKCKMWVPLMNFSGEKECPRHLEWVMRMEGYFEKLIVFTALLAVTQAVSVSVVVFITMNRIFDSIYSKFDFMSTCTLIIVLKTNFIFLNNFFYFIKSSTKLLVCLQTC